ncbi:MAG: matrixin family metalloprotease [Verrucomicrobiales bacterium]
MFKLKNTFLAFTVGIIGAAGNAGAIELGGASMLAPGSPYAEDFIVGPTAPGKWGSPVFGTGATVTWSLMATGIPTEDDSSSVALSDFMPAGYKAEIEAAFAAWSAVADITFVEVADSGVPFNAPEPAGSGDIRIAGTLLDGAFGTLAHGYYPPANGTSAAGDIHFDTADTWKIGFGGPGFDIFQVAAHEIGHAIGLDHTGVPDSLMNPFYTESFSGLQADDIAGAVFIYGLPRPVGVPEGGSTLVLLGIVMFSVGGIRRKLR